MPEIVRPAKDLITSELLHRIRSGEGEERDNAVREAICRILDLLMDPAR